SRRASWLTRSARRGASRPDRARPEPAGYRHCTVPAGPATRSASVDAGARRLDHRPPGLDFGLDELPEFLRAGVGRHGTQATQAFTHFRLGQGVAYSLVQRVHDIFGHALRANDAEPRRHVEIRET